jgi:hypothetical protein
LRAEDQERALTQEQAARAEAENSQKRASLLAEASRVLSASFDYQTTLAALVRLAVPAMADYCALDIVEGKDTFKRIGEAHVDPAKSKLIREVATFPQSALTAQHPLMRVMATGNPVLEADITPAFIRAAFAEEGQRRVVEALEPRSLICVPLVASGKSIGEVFEFTARVPDAVEALHAPRADKHLQLLLEYADGASQGESLGYVFASEPTLETRGQLAVVSLMLENTAGARQERAGGDRRAAPRTV